GRDFTRLYTTSALFYISTWEKTFMLCTLHLRRPTQTPRRLRSYRPRLEMLEDRNLLSTFTVDHLADDLIGSGLNGSLRYCITNAVDNDTITFGVTGTINLSGALPALTHSVTIQGPGPDLLTVRRNTSSAYRIFTGRTIGASLEGLTISNGLDDYEG